MKFGYRIKATWKGNERFYNIWNRMLARCYDEKHNRFNAYKNVTVCERWFCFDYFIEDVKTLEGWDKELFQEKIIQLDKDLKQMNEKNKIYSKETCIWLDKRENNKFQMNHVRKFKAISPSGIEYIYYSQHECAREHELCNVCICKCLNGGRKTHKKWRFTYVD